MNRIEFMLELAALLQDVPVEERTDAMQYYNDYFDAAGEENEQKVISELESPKKVAEKLKAGLDGRSDLGGAFTENGYQDFQFDSRKMPVSGEYPYEQNRSEERGTYENERHNRTAKVILLAAIILIGAPIVIPLVIAIIGVIFGVVIGIVAGVAGIGMGTIAILISGIFTAGVGIVHMFTAVGEGLLVSGIGLLLTAVGLLGSMAVLWVILKVVPFLFQGAVNICRKILQRGVRR